MAMMTSMLSARDRADHERAHVFLHDGMLRRIGELRAFDVSRSYLLGRAGVATFAVPVADPLIGRIDPDRGVTVVIESESFATPWVGYVSMLSGSAFSSALRVTCTEYSELLNQRYLPNHFETSGAMADEFRRVIDTVNGRNETLIRIGSVEDRAIHVSGLRLSDMSAWNALDLLAGVGLMEWYIDYSVDGGVVSATANLVAARGADRRGAVMWNLGPTGDAVLTSWTRSSGALPAVGHVIGGDATGVETFDEHPRATSVSTSGAGRGLLIGRQSRRAPESIHGYQRFTPKASSPATRLESLVHQVEAQTSESVVTIAEAVTSRPTFAERTGVLRILDPAHLGGVELGDVIAVDAGTVPGLGRPTAGRAMAVTLDSARAGATVEVQLLGGRSVLAQ